MPARFPLLDAWLLPTRRRDREEALGGANLSPLSDQS
jgi:hypothetical protein